ncbi:MAG TPA: hypothetical protein VIR60_08360 [Gammaproteobacteria bacterium]
MSPAPLTLSLLIPGLLGPLAGMDARAFIARHCPTLAILLSRAQGTHEPADTDALRYRLLGYALSESHDRPDAWLSYQFDTGAVAPGALLRADPVHLRANQSGLVLFDAENLHVTAAEARALADTFNQHYAAEGLRLELPTPTRGYLHLSRQPDLRTTPLTRALGRDVDACLPTGPEAPQWHRFLNEVQMLFHTHPVNQAREARGQPMINSLWLWGGGRPLTATASDWRQVWCHDAALRGLAWLNGIRASEPSSDAHAWLREAVGDRHLMYVDGLRHAGAYADLESWSAQMERWEHDWFAPLTQALRQGQLKELRLYPDDGRLYRVSRWDLWKFWRKP